MEVKSKSLYQKFVDMQNEILVHKWLESEKAGYDIGFETALVDWMEKHRRYWTESVHKNN